MTLPPGTQTSPRYSEEISSRSTPPPLKSQQHALRCQNKKPKAKERDREQRIPFDHIGIGRKTLRNSADLVLHLRRIYKLVGIARGICLKLSTYGSKIRCVNEFENEVIHEENKSERWMVKCGTLICKEKEETE